MTRPSSADPGHAAGRQGASRRTVLRTGAWSAPVILASTAAPAFAASAGSITGAQQVVRSAFFAIDSTGTVTNSTPTNQTVTLTWTWLCDSAGAGAGRFTGGTTDPSGWTVTSFVYVAGSGDQQRGVRLVVNRVMAAGTTVSFPPTNLSLSGLTVTGTVTAVLGAPAPATVVQPAQVTFPAFTGFGGRQSATSSRRTAERGSGLVVIGSATDVGR